MSPLIINSTHWRTSIMFWAAETLLSLTKANTSLGLADDRKSFYARLRPGKTISCIDPRLACVPSGANQAHQSGKAVQNTTLWWTAGWNHVSASFRSKPASGRSRTRCMLSSMLLHSRQIRLACWLVGSTNASHRSVTPKMAPLYAASLCTLGLRNEEMLLSLRLCT